MSTPPEQLSSLLDLHDDLDEVFWLHQEALVTLKLELASELLAAYERLLRVHMRHEEEHVLPLFERAGPVLRWPVVLYTGQHKKMLELLASCHEGLAELRRREGKRRRGALALVSFQATYKHLVEHHDGAEREGLYAVVDRSVSLEEQARVAKLCQSEWTAALDAERALLHAARQTLDTEP